MRLATRAGGFYHSAILLSRGFRGQKRRFIIGETQQPHDLLSELKCCALNLPCLTQLFDLSRKLDEIGFMERQHYTSR
jgi:hypothetical protein